MRLPLRRFLLAVEAWGWRRVNAIGDARLHAQAADEFQRMLEAEPDEDRWGETPAAQAQQDNLGAVTPTMGFIE